MKLSDIMGHAGLSGYAQVALVLFFSVFCAVVWRLYGTASGRAVESAAQLPFDDAPPDTTPRQAEVR